MESRAWGANEKRTNLYVLKLKRADYILVVVSVLMIIAAVYIWLYIPIPSLTELFSL